MDYMPLMAIVTLALLIVSLAITYFALKVKREAYAKTGKHPKGHYVGLGMILGIAIFMPIGIGLSIATDNMGLMGIGPALGVGVGLSIGAAWEKRHEKELRPLTKEEERFRHIGIMFGVGLLILGVVVFGLLFFLSIG